MHLDTSTLDDQLLVVPTSDRLDTANAAPFLRDCLARLDGKHRVVIDLGAVDFIDSTGLGALVAVRRAVGEQGRLRLVSSNPRLRLLLEMTRLAGVLPMFTSVHEAVEP